MAYGRDLRDFLKFCRDRGVSDDPEELNPHLVQMYLHELALGPKNETSARRALVAIRMLLEQYAKSTGRIDDDGSTILETPKTWQKLPIVCNKRQVADLLAAPCPEEPVLPSATRPCWSCFTRPACGPASWRASTWAT